MKKLIFFTLILLSLSACKEECAVNNSICYEEPPTNELCAAYFERWFFNENTNICEKISYSGCSAYGFELKEECEGCACDN